MWGVVEIGPLFDGIVMCNGWIKFVVCGDVCKLKSLITIVERVEDKHIGGEKWEVFTVYHI